MQELAELIVVDGALPLLAEVHLDEIAVKVEGNFLVERRLLDHLHELLCGEERKGSGRKDGYGRNRETGDTEDR